ncbi:MAG TPA: alanine racemase, partial [Polyangiaceae bacterium]|nr:alanine racemase [Polyangiaceae bacterium]
PAPIRVLTPRRAAPADSVRPTRAEISLGHLRHNLAELTRVARVPIWSVLKADAYGHGAKAVARTLERAGSAGICVALTEEAIELREAGIVVPILVMGSYYDRAWSELLEHQLTPVLSRIDQIEQLAEEVRERSAPAFPVHVKIDTGMARLGVPLSELGAFAACLSKHPELRLDGVMTHFASAESDPEFVARQLALFDRGCAVLARAGLEVRRRHAANTAALLAHPEARLELVRPGIGLFGMAPGVTGAPELEPVMRVRTEIVSLRTLPAGASVGYGATFRARRESRIATIPMGYGDGLSRALSNRGQVLVRGRRAPIAGTVSMDMTSIDVTEIAGASIGDEVVVLGPQRGPLGEDRLAAEEIAAQTGTIAWEVLTAVSRRVPRFYRED